MIKAPPMLNFKSDWKFQFSNFNILIEIDTTPMAFFLYSGKLGGGIKSEMCKIL